MIYINLGSNLGDRRSTLESAVALLEAAFGARARLSRYVESEPWGYASPNTFINVCAAFDTDHSPREAFALMQDCEHRIDPSPHRLPDGSYADRRIDIDFAAFTDPEGRLLEAEYPDIPLTIPHPHLHDRPFFLEPFRELYDAMEPKPYTTS